MVAIHAGSGMVEWEDGSRGVRAGQAIFLRPGEWHRYRPTAGTGWREEWIELRGPLVDKWLDAGWFNERIVTLRPAGPFFEIFEQMHNVACSSCGRASSIAGELLGFAIILLSKVLGTVPAGPRRPESRVQALVERAMEAFEQGTNITQTARALGISYPTLHRHFLATRGISPKQAATQMRHARAEVLLAENNLSIKEIAAELGFHSASHFSLAFKRSHGTSPAEWRRVLAFAGRCG